MSGEVHDFPKAVLREALMMIVLRLFLDLDFVCFSVYNQNFSFPNSLRSYGNTRGPQLVRSSLVLKLVLLKFSLRVYDFTWIC